MKIKAYLMVFILILDNFSGIEDDNESLAGSYLENSEQILTVIIEKLGIDILEDQNTENPRDFITGILRWKLRAIPAPKMI